MTTVVPPMSIAVSHLATSSGTPRRCHASSISGLLTVSNAFFRSYEVLCRSSSCSSASSMAFMCIMEAVPVLLPNMYPCCAGSSTLLAYRLDCIFRSTMELHTLRKASQSIKGRSSSRVGESVGFFGIGTSHLHFQDAGMCFAVQN